MPVVRSHNRGQPPADQLPGLGDAVAAATTAAGIKPCGGCARRKAAMNRATPGWLKRVLHGIFVRVKQILHPSR